MSANDTDFGIEGNFCLPSKPTTACTQVPTDPNARMQGVWRWGGWAGVNVQGWECACPYPSFYPMDTTPDSISRGACKKSSALCRGGTWTYPCEREGEGDGPCAPLTAEETAELVGADVLAYGKCECEEGDRLSMGGAGVPVCVKDTCSATPGCDESTPCPGGASCVAGTCVTSTSSCEEDVDCGVGGRCNDDGKCSWGHWKAHDSAPWTFGECQCPESCHSVGTMCAC